RVLSRGSVFEEVCHAAARRRSVLFCVVAPLREKFVSLTNRSRDSCAKRLPVLNRATQRSTKSRNHAHQYSTLRSPDLHLTESPKRAAANSDRVAQCRNQMAQHPHLRQA